MGKMEVRGQPRQSIHETPWAPWYVPVIPATGKHKWEDCKLASLGIKQDSILKITNTLKAGGVAQVMECLPTSTKPRVQTPVPPKKYDKHPSMSKEIDLILSNKWLSHNIFNRTHFKGILINSFVAVIKSVAVYICVYISKYHQKH
jgi:hypothetical protein